MIEIISRSEWDARRPRRRSTIPTPTPELWLHHSAGGERGASGVRQIQRFHMDTRGWSDIAYSFVIDRESLDVYEGRGAGVLGGHTRHHNAVSHAICVMGNFEINGASDDLLGTIAKLVRHGHQQGWWPSMLSGGHRDVGSTACPGRNLYSQVDEINRRAVVDDEEDDDMALRRGVNGEAIRRFQTGLKGWNPDSLPGFGADGDFGAETETWIRNFQSAQDLPATGAIDGVTAALLLEFRVDDVDDSA